MNRWALALVSVLLVSSPVFAFPSLLGLDGFLTNSSGSALNSSYSFVFTLYNVSSGGTALWSETQTLSVSSGKLNALLGSVAALNLPFDQDYYLGVKVSADSEMSPRYRVSSSAYAYTAKNLASGANASGNLYVSGNQYVNGDLTVANRAQGMVYRASAYDLAGTNTWYDIPFNGGDSNLVNVAHSTTANPERVTVNVNGTYLIQYLVHYRRQGAAHHGAARLYKNGASEILGSFTMAAPNTGDANEDAPLLNQVMTSLSASDYVTVQAGTNTNVANEIDVFDDGTLPDPTTRIYASLTIVKIGP